MKKEEYIDIVNNRNINEISKKLLFDQIDTYYQIKENFILPKHSYKVGDKVFLPKHTLLHGTYKNIDGLKEIIKDGLISSWFINGRGTKYPSSVGVWNLKQDYKLEEYINFYSGGTIKYFNQLNDSYETEVISYNDMKNILSRIKEKGYLVWNMQQTKEARFLPSLVQNIVQIGIILNGESREIQELLKGDVLNSSLTDEEVKGFITPDYYNQFIIDRQHKDDFFTDRESAILFGIPANFIEGILVGRDYEQDASILKEIKSLLPNAYICNLDGIVIVE